MPKIKIKTVYIERLKALGVYDSWLANVKSQYNERHEFYIHIVHGRDVIEYPFIWIKTPEGDTFWKTVYDII